MSWLRDGLRLAGDDARFLTSSAGSAADGTAEYVAFGTEHRLAQVFLQVSNPLATAAMRKALRDFNPDVVVVNMFAHHLSPSVVHAIDGRPLVFLVSDFKIVCPTGSKLLPNGNVCTEHAGAVCHRSGCVTLPHWLRDVPRYASIRSAVRKAHKVLACSEWVQKELAFEGIQSDCMYLPVPQPSSSYTRQPADRPIFLYCGRLDPEKGVDVLLRAFAFLIREQPDAKLRLAGRGALENQLKQLTRDLGLESSVEFLGWVAPPMIETELSRAWALVAPSLWAEPLGLVALEAIVHGVPVIATATGGFAETVAPDTGSLVPNGSIDALAREMSAIAAGAKFPDHRLDHSAVTRISKRHSVTDHISQLRSVFTQLIA
jgi:glycosyltransferase involved in cell wall biosynthesis